MGNTDYDFIDKDLADFFRENDKAAMVANKPSMNEEQVTYADDGHRELLETIKTPMYDAVGKLIGVLGIARDITGRKQAEVERENLISELEAKNAELERFTYTVSHDLKSPLITINGFIGYLEEDATSGNMERFKEDIQRIQGAVKKMQRLLNELLELSRIGRLMNPPEDVPFNEIAQEVLEILHGQLEARGVAVKSNQTCPLFMETVSAWWRFCKTWSITRPSAWGSNPIRALKLVSTAKKMANLFSMSKTMASASRPNTMNEFSASSKNWMPKPRGRASVLPS